MEYKFRGYDIIGNKWVYGDLTHNQKVTKIGLEPRVMVGGYEIDPDSVGLFTGLYDKKGNSIYEGDIFVLDNLGPLWDKKTVAIEWDEFALRFDLGGFNIRLCIDTEIIGNVYQNQELIEK